MRPVLQQLELSGILGRVPSKTILLSIKYKAGTTFLQCVSPQVGRNINMSFGISPFGRGGLRISGLVFDNRLPFPSRAFSMIAVLTILRRVRRRTRVLERVRQILIPKKGLVLAMPSM